MLNDVGSDFEYEKPAKIDYNETQQVNLANLFLPLKNDQIVAFCENSNQLQLGKVTSFENDTATVSVYTKKSKMKNYLVAKKKPYCINSIQK